MIGKANAASQVLYKRGLERRGISFEAGATRRRVPGELIKDKKDLHSGAESGILDMQTQVKEARDKIIDGSYSAKVIEGRQRKHIEGTKEFEQKRQAMHKNSPGSEPSVLTADAEELVERYKGAGNIKLKPSSPYPYEEVDTDSVVGKTWVKNLQKYVDTKRIRIIYSSKGVHVIPINDYSRR
jgi:hypothetical protein